MARCNKIKHTDKRPFNFLRKLAESAQKNIKSVTFKIDAHRIC